jgi:ketosteroid isomerase-like protein
MGFTRRYSLVSHTLRESRRRIMMRTLISFTACSIIALPGLAVAACDRRPIMESNVLETVRHELQNLDKEWSAVIMTNDTDAIGRFISDDWVIIGPEGNVIDRSRFLGVIQSGDLKHDSMESDDWLVRVYGDTAVVVAQAKSTGKYKGEAFATHERSTSVFVRKEGRWQCVLTQLTPIAKK